MFASACAPHSQFALLNSPASQQPNILFPQPPYAYALSVSGSVTATGGNFVVPNSAGVYHILPHQSLPRGVNITVDAEGQITLVCPEGNLLRVEGARTVTLSPELCVEGKSIGDYFEFDLAAGGLYRIDGSLILEGGVRDNPDERQIAAVLFPRNTYLSKTPSQLSWTSVDTAVEYSFQLISDYGDFNDIAFKADEIDCKIAQYLINQLICTAPWPSEWPLLPEKGYFLTARTRLRIGERSWLAKSVWLKLLSESQKELLANEMSNLAEATSEPADQLVLRTLWYQKFSLYADALNDYTINTILQNSPELLITAGHLYLQVGLSEPAINSFQEANRLLENNFQLVVSTLTAGDIAFSLGLAYFMQQDYKNAESQFLVALQRYDKMSATEDSRLEERKLNAQRALDEARFRLPPSPSSGR